MGMEMDGDSWVEQPGGVATIIALYPSALDLINGQLVDNSYGLKIYLEKVEGQAGEGFAGRWIETGTEAGDGTAQPLDGAMALKIQLGGTMTLISAGIDASGIWREAEDGITITVHSQKFKLPYRDGKLSLITKGA
jgi:hypothetical protein